MNDTRVDEVERLQAEVKRLRSVIANMYDERAGIINKMADRNTDLVLENQRLQSENAKLSTALTEVEWEYLGYNESPTCPWCAREKLFGHADDCQRQLALEVDTDDVGEIQAVIDDWLAGCPQPSI